MAEMEQILGLMGLLGSRLHVHLEDHQSAGYASFHERMKSIDWKTEDEEILRAVAEAVANLPPPTTTND